MRNLLADCANCFGLCCVALPFSKSSDFATTKASGEPCRSLRDDFSCEIHAGLRESGFRGCTAYDCFGAGQKVSQDTFDGRSWRESQTSARSMFDVFPVVSQLHELLWYLNEVVELDATMPIHERLAKCLEATESLADGSPAELSAVDIESHRSCVNALLLEASDLVRAQVAGRKKNFRGVDLIGTKMAGSDLRGASFRGAYLIGADLRRADLRYADMIGADMRGADLRGANLGNSLFVTQFQINSAVGDASTRIPDSLTVPSHWGLAG